MFLIDNWPYKELFESFIGVVEGSLLDYEAFGLE